jgi:uncharacterized LabA/DUF88 family protein
MRIKNKTIQKRLRKTKSKRGGSRADPEPPRPPRPAPPPFVLDNALVGRVQAEITRLNQLLDNFNNNNIQDGRRLFLRLIIHYFTTVLGNYRQSSDNVRGIQMVTLLNQMLIQSRNIDVGTGRDAMQGYSQQIGDTVLLAHGDDDMYN